MLIPSRSPEQEGLPTQGDHQAEFYKDYHKVAKEYDEVFLKDRKEDLDTILIFVSFAGSVAGYALIKVTGWSFFRRLHRIHHSDQLSAPARPG